MEEKNEMITRFITNRCTAEESQQILKMAHKDPALKKELIELRNLYIQQSMPGTSSTNKEYSIFKEYIAHKELDNKIRYSANDLPQTRRKKGKILYKFICWSAAACIAALLTLNLKYHWTANVSAPAYPVEAVSEDAVTEISKENLHTLYTAKGIKGETILPDGSRIILNSDSRITYPSKFHGPTRDIEFSGEGYFQVKKDSLHPMVIRCNKNFKVVVYGTEFNIKSYENDNKAKTTLISGSIKIIENIGGKEFVRDIAPDQTYTIEENKQYATLKKGVDTQRECEWKDGILSFNSTPLHEAAKIMERWHGLKIEIQDPQKRNIPITARFTTESIVQIMDLLKFSTNIGYTIKDNIVTIK